MTPDLPPCPFCGERLGIEEHYALHPGTVTDGKCLFSGRGIPKAEWPLWSNRKEAHP